MPTSLAKLYNEEVYKKLTYHGTWTPTEQWELGDVLILQNGSFTHSGENLTDYDIDFEIKEGEEKMDDSMSFSSTGTSENKINAQADVATVGKAKIEISFNNAFGVIFKTKGYKISRIQRQGDLGEKIKAAYNKDPERWKNRAVILELIQVSSGTILISQEKGSSLTIEGNVEKAADLNIADAKLGLTTKNKRGAIIEHVATSNLTPLFKMGRPAKAWLSNGVVIRTRSDDPIPEGAEEIIDFNEKVSLKDLE